MSFKDLRKLQNFPMLGKGLEKNKFDITPSYIDSGQL